MRLYCYHTWNRVFLGFHNQTAAVTLTWLESPATFHSISTITELLCPLTFTSPGQKLLEGGMISSLINCKSCLNTIPAHLHHCFSLNLYLIVYKSSLRRLLLEYKWKSIQFNWTHPATLRTFLFCRRQKC